MKQQRQQQYSEEAFLAVSLLYLNQFICPAVQRTSHEKDDDAFYNCSQYPPSPEKKPSHPPHCNNMDERRLRLLEFQQSDIETADRKHQEKQQLAQQFLQVTGELLAQADRELTQWENNNNNMIGDAIVRGAREMADAVAHMADTLQQEHHRRALTEAGLQDFTHSLQLLEQNGRRPSSSSSALVHAEQLLPSKEVVAMSQQEMDAAMKVLAELLRDVEVALRSIEPEEADEIAEVAVSVAHVFLLGLQHVHAQITPDELVAAASSPHDPYYLQASPQIEELVTDDEDGVPVVDENIQIGPRVVTPTSASIRSIQPPRLRCLWPPVAPAISDFLHWSAAELRQKHWAVQAGLGLVLWPYAVGAAVLGAPALVADHLVQQTYDHFADSPVVAAAEVAAGQVGQTARLSFLTARAVARPALRVATRQVQRHGPGVVEWTQDKLHHPVRTVHEAGSGVVWCSHQAWGWVQDRHHAWQCRRDNDSSTSDAAAAMMNI